MPGYGDYVRIEEGFNDFFNVKDVNRLLIYISRIDVKAFGATGVDKYKMSYEGVAVDYQEMLVGNQIKELFSFFIPRLAEASKKIGKILLSDISVKVLASPENESDIDDQSSIITLEHTRIEHSVRFC